MCVMGVWNPKCERNSIGLGHSVEPVAIVLRGGTELVPTPAARLLRACPVPFSFRFDCPLAAAVADGGGGGPDAGGGAGSTIHTSKSLAGPWTPLAPNTLPRCGNPAPHVHRNGSLFVVCQHNMLLRAEDIRGPSRANSAQTPLFAARTLLKCHRSTPGHAIAAVRELKSSLWATAGGKRG